MKVVRIILLAFFVVLGLAYLNAIIPQSHSSAHVDNFVHSDTCGRSILQVNMQDDSCGGFFKSGNDYSTTGQITNTAPYRVDGIQLHFKSYFCTSNSQLSSSGSCTQNYHPYDGPVFSLQAGQSMTFSTPTLHASDYGNFNSCGLFQNDFWFSYNNGTCTSSLNGNGTGFGFAGVGYCKLWDGHNLVSNSPWVPKWECSAPSTTPSVTPSTSPSVTPSTSPSVTPSVTPTTPSASCYFSPANLQLNSGDTGTSNLFYSTENISENAKQVTVCLSTDNGAPSFLANTAADVTNVSGSVSVNAPHTYTASMYLKNIFEGPRSCSGTVIAACNLTTTVVTTTVTPTSGGGCTSNCGNTYITQQQQQQQQQQIVLAASVAPAPTANSLPSTGAEDLPVIGTLISMGLAGWKIRRLI